MMSSSHHHQRRTQHTSYGSWMSSFDSLNQPSHYFGDHHSGRYHWHHQQNQYMYYPKCTEVPQFDALHNAAAEFHCDEKLHLRHLCNDTARCSGLTAVHLSAWSSSTLPSSLLENDGYADEHEQVAYRDHHYRRRNVGLHRPNSMDEFDMARDEDDDHDDDDHDHDDLEETNEQQYLLQRFGNRSKMLLDYSRQQVTGETMELLFDLADAVHFTQRREAFRTGEKINVTEDKPVLHHVLRMPMAYDFPPVKMSRRDIKNGNDNAYNNANANNNNKNKSNANGSSNNTQASKTSVDSSQECSVDVLEAVHQVRESIEAFSKQIRSTDHSVGLRGVTNKRITDTVVVSSSGGMHLGIEFVHRALSADKRASKAAEGRRLHFMSSIDPVDTFLTTANLDPERTLLVVVSKDFANTTELSNFRSIRYWLVSKLQSCPGGEIIPESDITEKHIVGITCSISPDQCLGIPEQNLFRIWDWVIGRFSVCSAVGILPLSLQYSYEIVSEFLGGAHDMDEHFFNAPLRDNIPVLLGLLGVWNSTFMGYTTRAVIPYAEALRGLSTYVQLVDMESNGKRVAVDGTELWHQTGEIGLGEPGGGTTNHPFFQLMHQGRVIPADFIGFMESPCPLDLPGEAVSSHDELMCNFFGQPDALAYGKELMDLVQEGVPDGLREHMVFSGNRPSSSILMTRLDPFSVGQLVALYEHRTAVQGFLWGINSFDQYGIQLGCTMSSKIRQQLAGSRRTGATVQGFNQSTTSLLEVYLAHGQC
mmetsp:Transcript_3656/g.10349  ORF Transcript_3656/g.10349 Transcript_3656/m.10349 type:complete len:761 (+) Transcript_3656:209-2491(+)